MYYVYLLRCRDNSLYCGQTNDLKKRIKEHNYDKKRGAKYLRGRKPVTLVYVEEYTTIQKSLKREMEIKQFKKERKEQLVLQFSSSL